MGRERRIEETVEVRTDKKENLYVQVPFGLLDSTLLTESEKMVYIVLKSYLNFTLKEGDVHPTLETIGKRASLKKTRVISVIKSLENKGIIDKKQQGLNKPNVYTLRDRAEIWQAQTVEEMQEIAKETADKTEEEIVIERLKKRGYTIIPPEDPEDEHKKRTLSVAAEQSPEDVEDGIGKDTISNDDVITNPNGSQVEVLSLEQVKQKISYDALVNDKPQDEGLIEEVTQIIYDTVNTGQKYVRIGGESKPVGVVRGQLMKLDYYMIMSVLDKFIEICRSQKIKNTSAYLLRMLYEEPKSFNSQVEAAYQYNSYN